MTPLIWLQLTALTPEKQNLPILILFSDITSFQGHANPEQTYSTVGTKYDSFDVVESIDQITNLLKGTAAFLSTVIAG